eukprot:m.100451 g.100451  ORF g.100451 m.100451 type:complete len:507 (-) comp8929_c0_seq3:697-2217(-)
MQRCSEQAILAAADVLGLGARLASVARLCGVKAALSATNDGPLGCGCHVVGSGKVGARVNELVELVIVDPSVPATVDEELLVCNERAVGMLVLTCQLVFWQKISQLADKAQNFLVVRHVFHRERGCLGVTAKRDTLDFDKVWLAKLDQIRILLQLVHIPGLDQSEAVDGALALLAKSLEAVQEARPEVAEERAVDLLEAILVGCIDRHVKLADGLEVADGIGKLCVGHQERRDVTIMQHAQKLVDFGIHDGLADQRESAVLDLVSLLEALGLDALDTLELADHVVVVLHRTVDDELGIVHLPLPLGANGVGVMAPAEDTFVGTGKAWSCLHATVAFNAVKRVLVAAASTTQHRLGPTAQLDARVRSDELVALLCESLAQKRGDHLAGSLVSLGLLGALDLVHHIANVLHVHHAILVVTVLLSLRLRALDELLCLRFFVLHCCTGHVGLKVKPERLAPGCKVSVEPAVLASSNILVAEAKFANTACLEALHPLVDVSCRDVKVAAVQ